MDFSLTPPPDPLPKPYRVFRERYKPVSRGHLSTEGRTTFCGRQLNGYEYGEDFPPVTAAEFVDEVTDRCARCLNQARILKQMAGLDALIENIRKERGIENE
jgi:hypothetical protein